MFRSIAAIAALVCALTLSACSEDTPEPASGSEENPVSADNPQTHEELQNPAGGVIRYGLPIPKDEELHEVVVDGKVRRSLFTQENLDFAEETSMTREEYESAFLNFVACIE